MIYNSISDTCSIVFVLKLPIKWSVFDQKHRSNSTKCPVNKLKATLFTASFSPCDIIESCVEILASISEQAREIQTDKTREAYVTDSTQKQDKLSQHVLPIAQRGRTSYGNICHLQHKGIEQAMATYVTNSTKGLDMMWRHMLPIAQRDRTSYGDMSPIAQRDWT